MKLQQRGLSVPNSDSVKPDKPLIPDKYNNSMKPEENQQDKVLY